MDLPKRADAQKLETLNIEMEAKRLTVIVSGSTPQNIIFANQIAQTLPGTVINEYKGFLQEKGKILIVPALTSMLEQDACLILKIETVDDTTAIRIAKNRSGRTGYLKNIRIPSP